MLPGRDGLDILKALRQKDFALPVFNTDFEGRGRGPRAEGPERLALMIIW